MPFVKFWSSYLPLGICQAKQDMANTNIDIIIIALLKKFKGRYLLIERICSWSNATTGIIYINK